MAALAAVTDTLCRKMRTGLKWAVRIEATLVKRTGCGANPLSDDNIIQVRHFVGQENHAETHAEMKIFL